jgi:hypothetical protein
VPECVKHRKSACGVQVGSNYDIPAPEAFSGSRQEAPEAVEEPARGWRLAQIMLGGIKSMGRAVKISGKVVDKVNSEAQDALRNYKKVCAGARQQQIAYRR